MTNEVDAGVSELDALLSVLEAYQNSTLIFTLPNPDPGSHRIINMIVEFCSKHANAHYFESLGQQIYLSCVNESDGVIGNSSSGLIEIPSLKKGTINVGKRQAGRICATSVINCKGVVHDIERSIKLLLSGEFQNKLSETVNPYGEGCPSEKIIKILEGLDLQEFKTKHFVDFF